MSIVICFLLAGYSVQSGSMIYTDVFSSMFGLAAARLPSFCRRCSILFFYIIIWALRADAARLVQRRI
jgi:hypothetical protein